MRYYKNLKNIMLSKILIWHDYCLNMKLVGVWVKNNERGAYR